jgi:hypothetical protein
VLKGVQRERDGFLCRLAEGEWSFVLGSLGVVLCVATTVWELKVCRSLLLDAPGDAGPLVDVGVLF